MYCVHMHTPVIIVIHSYQLRSKNTQDTVCANTKLKLSNVHPGTKTWIVADYQQQGNHIA